MKVTFLGTGVAVPCEGRAQSSILIEEDVIVLLDAGIGAFLRLDEVSVNPNDIDAILLTHNHLDHNGDVLNILKARWLLEGDSVDIYGPAGTAAILNSLLEAYPYLRNKVKFRVFEANNFKVGNLKIRAVPTIHSIESRGYVIDNALAVSGDTKAFKEFISQECSVMVHELSLPFNFAADYHTTPENLKENLRFCKADVLYLTHLYPMTHAVRDKIVEYLGFNVKVAEDLMSFRV